MIVVFYIYTVGETREHLFLNCNFVVDVWYEVGMDGIKFGNHENDHLLFCLVQLLDDE